MEKLYRRILNWMYKFSKKELGLEERDWHNIKVVETPDFHVVTFTSTHKLDVIEQSTIFFHQNGMPAFDVELNLTDAEGNTKQLKDTMTIKRIEDRVLIDHYEKMRKESGRQLTLMTLHGVESVNGIQCQTTLVKRK